MNIKLCLRRKQREHGRVGDFDYRGRVDLVLCPGKAVEARLHKAEDGEDGEREGNGVDGALELEGCNSTFVEWPERVDGCKAPVERLLTAGSRPASFVNSRPGAMAPFGMRHGSVLFGRARRTDSFASV